MGFWEFLLQQEGDQSWLPLESPSVEILEGRYRVVARSSRINTLVEIRVVYLDINQDAPLQQVQKRSTRTNPEGLVMVMPYTSLLPGIWELRCTSDLMAEMMGENWKETVQLHVLPIDLEADWHPLDSPQDRYDIDLNQFFSPETSPQPVASAPVTEPAPVAELPQPSIEAEEQVPPEEAVLSSPAQPARPNQTQPSSQNQPPQIQLILDQDPWLVQRGQPLHLKGQIDLAAESPEPVMLTLKELHVRLYDPQNASILVDQRYPLDPSNPSTEPIALPLAFSLTIALPEQYQTYLMLGKLTLYGGETDEGDGIVLATQSFNVATELQELLEAIANTASATETKLPPNAPPIDGMGTAADLSFLGTPEVSQTLLQFQPAHDLSTQGHPAASSKARRSIELPAFRSSDPEAVMSDTPDPEAAASATPAVAQPKADLAVPLAETEPTTAGASIPAPETDLAPDLPPDLGQDLEPELLPVLNDGELALSEIAPPAADSPAQWADDFDPELDWQLAALDSPRPGQKQGSESKPPASPEDHAFRSLNLKNRFWNRLQSLVGDTSLSDTLRQPTLPPISPPPTYSPPSETPDPTPNPLVAEQVVEEAPYPIAQPHNSAPAASPPFDLDNTDPIPTPQLEIPTGELIAGQRVRIAIRLPDRDRLFVKFWMQDRQSRTIVDGPRWLVNFRPDGLGNLVCRSEIDIPQGCLEVQIEAITIDTASQCESNKAIAVRSVIPADLANPDPENWTL